MTRYLERMVIVAKFVPRNYFAPALAEWERKYEEPAASDKTSPS